MLMCALTRMAGAPDYYAATFAAPRPIPESQRLLYLYTMLSGLKIGDYTELEPMDFAPEFRKIGYDTEPLVPRYRPVMDILDNRPDLIPDTVRTLDSVRPDMFTYDGINFWDKLSDRARDTLESHVRRHMAATTDYARMHSGCEQNRAHHDQHLRWMDKMYAKIIIFRHIRAVTDNFRRQTRHPESIRITIHPAYRQWER